jgi:hypothetical protein
MSTRCDHRATDIRQASSAVDHVLNGGWSRLIEQITTGGDTNDALCGDARTRRDAQEL